MDRSRLAIIVPAWNEAATIAGVVERVQQYGITIVVDDGSQDDTARLARAAGAEVVSHGVNRGYDGALSSGFARAVELKCDYAITIDADGQHNPAQLGEMIGYLEQGVELVLGVRDRFQRVGETVFGVVGRALWRMSDPLCGMKAYSLALYRQVGHFDAFKSIGTELATRALVNGARFVEMPVITRDRQDAPRFGRRFAANYKIFRAMTILMCMYACGRLRQLP